MAVAVCSTTEAVVAPPDVEVLMTPPLTVLVVTAVLAVTGQLRVQAVMELAFGTRNEATGRRPAEAVG